MFQCVGDGGKKRGGVQVECLDKDRAFGVADAGELGFVLGYKDIAVVQLTVRWGGNKSGRERLCCGSCSIWCKLLAIRDLGSGGWDGTLFYCEVQLSICSLQKCLIRLVEESGLHARDFIGYIIVPMQVTKHVFGESSCLAIYDKLVLIACRSTNESVCPGPRAFMPGRGLRSGHTTSKIPRFS